MANENQNTGPNLNPSSNVDPKQLGSTLKELRQTQGDFQDSIRDSVRELNKVVSSYEKIQGTLNSLKTSTINIGKIEKEIEKAKSRQLIQSNKAKELEEKIGLEGKKRSENLLKSEELLKKKQEDLNRARLIGDKNLITAATRALIIQERSQERLKNNITIEEAAYAAQLKSVDLSNKQLQIAKEYLENEKDVAKSVGNTGKLLAFTSKYLGIGKGLYGKIVEEAREGENKTKTMVLALSSIPVIGLALSGLAKGLKATLDYILGIQDQTVKFARAMNMSTTEARRIKMEFASISVSSGDLFITSQKMVESQMEFVDALGVTNRLTNEQLATNIKLKDITGLDLETRKGIVEASTITGKSSETLTKSVLAQVVGLKSATGISFQYQKILKEASNLGGYLGLSFAKYPSQLTKSLITVKAMGMELKQLDQIADSFLDFESSISKEFEAQLLTGRDINLAKAREAFLNNDLATAAQEITSQVGSAGEFLKLNRIQAESLASAFGMSRDQMGDMLKQQELLAKLGAKQGDSAREQLRLGLERYKNQKELSAAIGEEAYQSLINASAQEKIAAFIEKVKQSLADFVEKSGIIDKIEGFIEYLSQPENIRAVVIKIRDVFASIVDIVATIATGIVNILDFVGAISDQNAASAKSFLSGAGNSIRSLGGDFGSVSVGGNVAASQVGGTNQAGGQANMAMARPGQAQAVNLNVVTKVVDSAADAQTRYSKGGYNEQQTGQ